jgi:hypothetical protein
MRISYNVAYHVNYMFIDGKRPTSRALHEADEVDVPEVSCVDAPLVLTWKNEERTENLEVRMFDGQYYEPLWQGSHRRVTPSDPRAAFETVLQPKDKAGTMPSASKIAYNLGDTRDAAVAARRQFAEGFLVVDGAPYYRCAQPRLMLEVDYERYVFYILHKEYRYDSVGHVRGIDSHHIVPIMDEATLLEKVRGLPQGNVWHRYRDIEIVLPDALGFDTKVEACGRTVAQGIADNERDMFFWPRPVAEELLAIRSEYELWRHAPAEVDIADLLDRLYMIYTNRNLYNQQLLRSFLDNFETVKRNRPEFEIEVAMGSTPHASP